MAAGIVTGAIEARPAWPAGSSCARRRSGTSRTSRCACSPRCAGRRRRLRGHAPTRELLERYGSGGAGQLPRAQRARACRGAGRADAWGRRRRAGVRRRDAAGERPGLRARCRAASPPGWAVEVLPGPSRRADGARRQRAAVGRLALRRLPLAQARPAGGDFAAPETVVAFESPRRLGATLGRARRARPRSLRRRLPGADEAARGDRAREALRARRALRRRGRRAARSCSSSAARPRRRGRPAAVAAVRTLVESGAPATPRPRSSPSSPVLRPTRSIGKLQRKGIPLRCRWGRDRRDHRRGAGRRRRRCSTRTRRTSPRCATRTRDQRRAPCTVTPSTSVDAARGRVRLRAGRRQVAAARRGAPAVVERGGIGAFCSLGNGLIQDRIEGIVGEGNLLACLVEWGGSNVGPGELIRDSLGGYVVGELDGSSPSARASSPRALEPIGRTRVTDNVRGMIWSKLRSTRPSPGSPRSRACATAAWPSRAAKRSSRCGRRASRWAAPRASARDDARRPPARVRRRRARADDGAHGQRPASMLQDLDAGRETEVDVVNGGVAGKGRELGIPTPCNDAVVELVHSMERGERCSDPAGSLRQRGADDRATEAESRPSPTRRVQLRPSKQWSASLPGISRSRIDEADRPA